MLYTPARLAVVLASCLAISFTSAVETFQVTTNLESKDSGSTEELKFSVCLNEDVINVVADEFINIAQSISPESSMAEQVESLKSMICNEHTSEIHSAICTKDKPAKFVDPVNPFSSVNLGGETHRISVREGQTAEDLTDCFCSKHTCSYHQGKHIEKALATKIANSQNTGTGTGTTSTKGIKIKSPLSASPSAPKEKTSTSSKKKGNKKK
jgi:hypothetical protein